jgi:protein transport protein SEC24
MQALSIPNLLTADIWIRHLLEALLGNLPDIYSRTVCAQAALGSSIAASLSLLSQTGGQVVIFASCLPKIGFGMLCK